MTPTDRHKKMAQSLLLRLMPLIDSKGCFPDPEKAIQTVAQDFADIEAKACKTERAPDLQSLLNVVRKLDFGGNPRHGKDFAHSFDDLRVFFTEDELASGKVRLIDTPEGE